MFEKLKEIVALVKREIKVWRLVMKDLRTPILAKFLVAIAIGYLLLPFELVPDFIPVIGQVDDLLIVGLLIVVALHLIPREIVEDCRKSSL